MFVPPITRAQAKTSASFTNSPARQRSASQAHRLGHGPAEQALTFHRAIGNQGMLRLLAAQRAASLTETPNMPFYPPARMGGSAPPSPVPTPRLPGPIQAKLNVGAVDDPLEHEADRIADDIEDGVRGDAGRRLGASVAAHVRGHRAIAGGGERFQLIAPRIPPFRKPVA